jgi:hypothetical protein
MTASNEAVTSRAIADEEPELRGTLAEVDHEVAGLLGGPGPVRMRSHTQDVQVTIADLEHEQDVEPAQRHRAVDMEESTATMLVAWVRGRGRGRARQRQGGQDLAGGRRETTGCGRVGEMRHTSSHC